MRQFDDYKWWAMCDAKMSQPVALPKAMLHRPFIYCREHGLFYVSPSHHQAAMSLLLAWQHGLNNGVDVAEKLDLNYSEETADLWLQTTPGAAFLSSVGNNKIQAGRPENINGFEWRWFESIEFIELI